MGGIRERAIRVARDMQCGHFAVGSYEVDAIRAELPIEVQAELDVAVERADFIAAADVILKHQLKIEDLGRAR